MLDYLKNFDVKTKFIIHLINCSDCNKKANTIFEHSGVKKNGEWVTKTKKEDVMSAIKEIEKTFSHIRKCESCTKLYDEIMECGKNEM